MSSDRVLLTGWGRTAPTAARVHRPAGVEDLRRVLAQGGGRGLIARGLGRSYGDPAQLGGGDVVDMTGVAGLHHLDLVDGRVVAEAGLSLHDLMKVIIPLGWFVPVTPGTRFVTLGGALAADIHGKNHHGHGSFADHVPAFELLDGDGELRRITAERDPDVFWATAGGMGLTGVIVTVELQLLRVRTSRMTVDTERATDLDDLLDRLERDDHRYPYSVAWIDCVTRGRSMGRGVLTRGWHADVDDLPGRARRDPLRYGAATRLRAPDLFPRGVLNRATVAAFNGLWFRKAPIERRGEVQPIPRFFHPLDGVVDWNRIYGPDGFVQYQFVVPPKATDPLRRCVEVIAGSGFGSFLAVLKRLGPGNDGMLSFPTEGWTLALDFPVTEGVADLLDRLDDLVAAAGGRVYLAKDSRLPAHRLPGMYPRLDEFRAVRSRLDPKGRFHSDLAKRLQL